MRRYLSLALLLILALTIDLRAENAVRFTDAKIEAGDRFVTEVFLECDQELFGWNLVLRWSTSDLRCDSVRIIRESFDPRFFFLEQPIEQNDRLIRLAMLPRPFGDPPFPIPVGSHLTGRLYFTCGLQAQDQIAFVDSAIVVHIDDYYNDTSIEASTYATPTGTALYPNFYPGRVTIGNPAPATILVTPSSLTLPGEAGESEPTLRSLQIQSDGVVQFDWEANWSSDWLDVTPSIGKTPAFPAVAADAFFLLPGVYRDTIVISSPIAENSPFLIPVAFTVDTAGTRPPAGFNFTLLQNRPNPFVAYSDPETVIPFLLEKSDRVEIAIYDILGRRVRAFMSAQYDAGESSVIWDGRDSRGRAVASGHYICRMTTSAGESSRVIVLIR